MIKFEKIDSDYFVTLESDEYRTTLCHNHPCSKQVAIGLALAQVANEVDYRDKCSSDGWDDDFYEIDTDTLIGWEGELGQMAYEFGKEEEQQ